MIAVNHAARASESAKVIARAEPAYDGTDRFFRHGASSSQSPAMIEP